MRMTTATAVLLLFATPAFGQPYKIADLPRDEVSLRELNSQQLRIVRRASRLCASSPVAVIRPKRNPCVFLLADKAVADSGNPALVAFHWVLPAYERYDEYRMDTDWRAFLVEIPAND